ncbi:MAG: DUF4394 domain-containing protein [Aphanocapsa sp. GSE-SYN-MK-11-07L]|jgi:hypothetical protein|nr:DUF4394 domain-containing protein [Aphanocapsa sp. GSE-SYN-MK-11-07L]
MKRCQKAVAISCLAIATLFTSTNIAKSTIPKSTTGADVKLIGLTSANGLVSFSAKAPTQIKTIQVTGLDGKLIGIDHRPANGLLYGLTSRSQLYTINPQTGAATLVSSLAKPLSSDAKVSIDFNPVPDRLRLVDSNGGNFRVNVDTGEMITDQPLGYMADDPNAGKTPAITAIAYTNAFIGPPSPAGVTPPTRTAQMFDLDTALNILVQQNPPNDGRLKTIGALNVNFSPTVGLDIFSRQPGENTAFAVSGSTLYTINLGTGATAALGSIGNGKLGLIDLAAAPMP